MDHVLTAAQTSSLEHRIQQALSGDAVAYADVLKQSAALLRPYLAKRLKQQSDVDDVLQEILLSIHKARHTYDAQRPYAPWMFAIARFRLNDYLRAHYHDHLRHAQPLQAAEQLGAAEGAPTPFSHRSLKRELGSLPDRQQAILGLIHGEGYTAREVAARLNMKEAAVKTTASRAYRALRRKLSD